MAMSSGGRGGQRAEINMTPMIDVLLVLIIIFMVIAPVRSRGLQALVPQTESVVRPAVTHPIVLTVIADGTAMLNQETMDLPVLRARLDGLYRNGAGRVIFVRAGKNIEFGRVADVIGLARDAGLTQVALMVN